MLVLVVVRVDEDGDTRGQEFRARRRDGERLVPGDGALAVGDQVEGDVVELRVFVLVFLFDLRDGGLAVGTPDGRCALAVLTALLVEVEER